MPRYIVQREYKDIMLWLEQGAVVGLSVEEAALVNRKQPDTLRLAEPPLPAEEWRKDRMIRKASTREVGHGG